MAIMRVDALSKVSQLYQNSNMKKTMKEDTANKPDLFEMSQTAKDYKVAKQAVSEAPDIREDRVNDIKNRMVAGTYNINSEEVADKLVESYFNATI